MNSPYMGKFRVSQTYKGALHDGLDLVGIDSKLIHSTVSGKVIFAGWENSLNKKQGFGQYVKIRKDGSEDVYYFGHLSEIKVKTEDNVKITDVIGTEGNTGKSTGSHCHYCVRRGGIKGMHKNVSEVSGIPNKTGTYDDGYREQKNTDSHKVTLKHGALSYERKRLAAFVYSQKFDILSQKGDRVVIGINGMVTAAVRAEDLIECT